LADDLERLRSGLPPVTAAAEKRAEMTTAPLPSSPEGRTRKTAVQPPVAPVPRKVLEHGGGRRRRLLPVLAALLFGLALLGGLVWALTQGFFRAGSVEVPSLESLTQEEAQELLAESSLSLGEVSEATSDSAPKGTVIEQEPQAGASVNPETSVNVTLSSGPEQISVPDLAGLSLAEAQRALSEAGLELGRQDEAPSDTVPVGAVIEQDPAAGTEVDEDTPVDIGASTGSAVQPVPAAVPPVYANKAANNVQEGQQKAAKGTGKQKEAEKKGKKKKKGKK
jgi:serine/threonine-protein kinase